MEGVMTDLMYSVPSGPEAIAKITITAVKAWTALSRRASSTGSSDPTPAPKTP